jgi:hypothetical protein
MNDKPIKLSPVFPAAKRWEFKRDPKLYESDITALVRKMLEDPEILEDQAWAWQRWRSGDNKVRQD